jgi:membrane protease subunit HflC
MKKLTIGIILVAVVGVLFLELFTFVARPYQTVLIDRFGKIIAKPTRIAYNWYLCWPTDRIVRMDMRLHLYQSDNREVSTREGEPISLRTFAVWKIVNPVLYYRRLPEGTLEAQRYLNQKIEGQVLKVMGRYSLDQLFNVDAVKIKMTQAEDRVQSRVNQDMQKLGLKVVKIGFSRVTFPPRVAVAVYRRMTAEREKIADKYISEGESQSRAIEAKGEAEAAEIRSTADKQAEEIRGQGDAKAYAILNAAQNTPAAQAFYRFWKSLELFKASMGQSTYWVLTPNNPITAPLFSQMKIIEGKTPVHAKVGLPAGK